MTRITWFTALSLIATILLSLTASVAEAQQQMKPLNDDPNVDCLYYRLDVMTLVDNDHQVYWKQHDCILVHVSNNPFLFTYSLKFDEQVIKEDDPLSAFGGKFGLNVSSVSGPKGADAGTNAHKQSDAKPALLQMQKLAAATKTLTSEVAVAAASHPNDPSLLKGEEALSEFKSTLAFDEARVKEEEPLNPSPTLEPYSLEQGKEGLQKVEEQINKVKDPAAKKSLQGGIDNVKKVLSPQPPSDAAVDSWTQQVKTLDDQAGDIGNKLNEKTTFYNNFSANLPDKLFDLRNPNSSLDAIRTNAQTLRSSATELLSKLSDTSPGAIGASATAESSKYEEEMLGFARHAATLHSDLVNAQISSGDTVKKLLDRLHTAGESVAMDACTYKAELDNDFSTLRTQLIDPLNKVLDDPTAFTYEKVAVKREGPWADPEQVTMTLHRDKSSAFTTSPDDPNRPANTTSAFVCSDDSSDLFANGAKYKTFDDFFTDKEVKNALNTYTRNQLKPASAPKAPATPGNAAKSPAKPATIDPDADVLLTQPWFFGKARLVLTGGLSSGFLTKQEFQRSSSISGTTSPTVIGFKTDTRYRFTPMLLGHTLLYSRRHDPDAWYATMGVTANSDSKGTSPEFLLGFSRSLVQQRFFVTLGTYIGEKQKLDGGLQVGQVIPAALTGELPVTKSYHAGWGFSISYRFASTKDPQKNSPAPTTPSGTR
jgi:hypothetical protein